MQAQPMVRYISMGAPADRQARQGSEEQVPPVAKADLGL